MVPALDAWSFVMRLFNLDLDPALRTIAPSPPGEWWQAAQAALAYHNGHMPISRKSKAAQPTS